jgi:predicted transcriptional regulator
MVTVNFSRTVKYKGIMYPANTNFKVVEEDVAGLKEAGAFVINEVKVQKQITKQKTAQTIKKDMKETVEEIKESMDNMIDSVDELIEVPIENIVNPTVPNMPVIPNMPTIPNIPGMPDILKPKRTKK